MTIFFIPVPRNGTLLGADVLAKIFPCGCEVECLDDGLHVRTCDDPDHEWAHRETCKIMAEKWKSEVVESKSP